MMEMKFYLPYSFNLLVICYNTLRLGGCRLAVVSET